MLSAYGSYNGVFIEITKSEHKHGGEGWGFGSCLWSPTTNQAGHDRYSLLRKPGKGDLVLHFYDDKWQDGISETRLCGYSRVSKPYQEIKTPPPSPGNWGNRTAYYRIDLQDFTWFSTSLPINLLINEYGDEIRQDILDNQPKFYPFNTHSQTIRTVQGIYLAQSTSNLYNILRRALGIHESSTLVYNKPAKAIKQIGEEKAIVDIHEEYTESRRRSAERFFFSRNPALTKAAKQKHGLNCQVCGFNYRDNYGDLGEGYIEVHHLNPLSERAESEWTEDLKTTVDDVTVLCASCHRMVHRRRPALSLDDLRIIIQKSANS